MQNGVSGGFGELTENSGDGISKVPRQNMLMLRGAVNAEKKQKTPECDQKLLSAKKWTKKMGHTASVPVPDVPDDLSLGTGRLRSCNSESSLRPLYRIGRPPKTPLKFSNPSTY